MVTEIAQVEIISDRVLEFESAMKVAVSTVLSTCHGYMDFELLRGVERPNTYTFIIHWESLDDHLVGFRESTLFTQWRELIGPFFAHPPVVEHWNTIFGA